MSQETLKYFKNLDIKNIETQFAIQCAPLITGLKISNLLIVCNSQKESVGKLIENTQISCFFLFSSEEKTTYLLYNRNKVLSYINEEATSCLLQNLGHQLVDLDEILSVIKTRYTEFASNNGEFPHELGLLLGYPAEDVSGFIENQGRDALFVGYWKVYENMPEKVNMFRLFDLAKNKVIKLVAQGRSIRQVINIYSSHNLIQIN